MVDVCIIGSGAGGSPIAYELANAGFSVVVLEKGENYTEDDFTSTFGGYHCSARYFSAVNLHAIYP